MTARSCGGSRVDQVLISNVAPFLSPTDRSAVWVFPSLLGWDVARLFNALVLARPSPICNTCWVK